MMRARLTGDLTWHIKGIMSIVNDANPGSVQAGAFEGGGPWQGSLGFGRWPVPRGWRSAVALATTPPSRAMLRPADPSAWAECAAVMAAVGSAAPVEADSRVRPAAPAFQLRLWRVRADALGPAPISGSRAVSDAASRAAPAWAPNRAAWLERACVDRRAVRPSARSPTAAVAAADRVAGPRAAAPACCDSRWSTS